MKWVKGLRTLAVAAASSLALAACSQSAEETAKGTEAAEACLQTVAGMRRLDALLGS